MFIQMQSQQTRDVEAMLRRWRNIKPLSVQRFVFAGVLSTDILPLNPFSAEIVFRRQNLTSVDVRF